MTADDRPLSSVDDLADGVVLADGDGAVTHVNPVAAALLRVDPDRQRGRALRDVLRLQDLSGHDWVDCVRPYDGLRSRRRIQESSWRTASDVEVLVTASLVRDRPGGNVTRVAVSLRHARGRERIERERSDLVATVAHELRSPLTGVKGFTATLLSKWERLNDVQRRMMLETVDADADRLTRLIGELLDAARIDSGRLRLRTQPCDLADVAENRLESLRATTSRPIELDVRGTGQVWIDRDKVGQVVSNLVENALMHGDGSVMVTVETRADGARLVVDDEGPGIPPETRQRVFTKFWTRAERDGSGLGLYIVRGLVVAHGGEVEVGDSPHGGARLRCWFPTGEPESVREPRAYDTVTEAP